MAISAARIRELVAVLPEAVESAHHGHPDFRVRKRIFATLSEAEDHAALRLTQLEARELALRQPTVYRLVSDREPYSYVSVRLDAVDEQEFGDLLEEAWKLRSSAT